jgi:hypothetical protein
MSRKYNVKHHRSKSKYPERLAARGMTSASVRMRVLTEKDTYKLLHPEKAAIVSENPDMVTDGDDVGKSRHIEEVTDSIE